MGIVDVELCLYNFDDALSIYAECKPFITYEPYKVVRSWYGCLALALSGDPVDEEDGKYLNDFSIRLKWTNWAFYTIKSLFIELEQRSFCPEKLSLAKEYHGRFVKHFDDEPLDFIQK